MIREINALLAPIRRRLDNLVARSVVSRVDDSKKLQLLQLAVLDGETREGCERVQQYGFTSVPLPGDGAGAPEAVVVFVGGFRDHPLVVAVDDRRWRKKDLQPGESALYSDEGDYVALTRGRIAELLAGTKFRAVTPLVECTGAVDAVGAINTADVFKVDGTQVVGPQQSAVAAPVGGATQDTEARTAINAIRAALSAHGLTA